MKIISYMVVPQTTGDMFTYIFLFLYDLGITEIFPRLHFMLLFISINMYYIWQLLDCLSMI